MHLLYLLASLQDGGTDRDEADKDEAPASLLLHENAVRRPCEQVLMDIVFRVHLIMQCRLSCKAMARLLLSCTAV
jgi:hypothetical protein